MLKWTESDVWQYIKSEKLDYCSLYDEGFKRLGCVMCPVANKETRLKEYYRFPKIAMGWYRGFERYYQNKYERASLRWKSADEMFWWWMEQPKPKVLI
jgi:phosphoadenosine phosphosulfate reductase